MVVDISEVNSFTQTVKSVGDSPSPTPTPTVAGARNIPYTVSSGTATLDATFNELKAMFDDGEAPYIIKLSDYGEYGYMYEVYFCILMSADYTANKPQASFASSSGGSIAFTADDEDTDMTASWS